MKSKKRTLRVIFVTQKTFLTQLPAVIEWDDVPSVDPQEVSVSILAKGTYVDDKVDKDLTFSMAEETLTNNMNLADTFVRRTLEHNGIAAANVKISFRLIKVVS